VVLLFFFPLPTLILPRFADRDLMMRFRGGGVGHKSTREATDFFKRDRDRLDTRKVTTDMPTSILDDEMAKEILEQDNDEPGDDGVVDEEEENDYGYVRDDSESGDSEAGGVEVGQDGQDDDSEQDFGPEDDAEAFDTLDDFGYADL